MTEIESVLHEERKFSPPASFAENANVTTSQLEEMYRKAEEDPEGFWAEQAESLQWDQKWNQTLDDSDAPFFKWYVGGKLNASANCLDRHLAERGDKPAIIWEGEPGDVRTITYREAHEEVCRLANVLKNNFGVQAGDTVTIYLPMIPEAAFAMLACARIGAPHSVVFGGFSAEALKDRIDDSSSKVVITADGGWRRGSVVDLKGAVDEALTKVDGVDNVLVVRRTEQDVKWVDGRDHWYHDVVPAASEDCPAEPFDAEQLLFILYTSGTTGKPKGVAHTTGGYMVHVTNTVNWIFDLKEDDVYWCTADVGWITGHSYIVYGPLSNGATAMIYEGAPNHPTPARFWELVEKHKATIFYTAPTAIRAFMKWGDEHPESSDLSSLRLLGTVGEPINPEAWIWYHKKIGAENCPIVDTWWQTETGGILISPFPGATDTRPGSATRPLPGIAVDIVDGDGNSVDPGDGGFLVIRRPWPSMLRTVYGDPERFKEVYWSKFPGIYFAGDGARQDADGYLWVMGRVDDVVNVSGHRLGTAEVESALVSHPSVVEAAVVARPDEITGSALVAFCTLEPTFEASEELKAELRAHVGKEIGAIAKPAEIRFADALPKTRSGKIMRRLLRDIAEGHGASGDTSTLEDRKVLEQLMQAE